MGGSHRSSGRALPCAALGWRPVGLSVPDRAEGPYDSPWQISLVSSSFFPFFSASSPSFVHFSSGDDAKDEHEKNLSFISSNSSVMYLFPVRHKEKTEIRKTKKGERRTTSGSLFSMAHLPLQSFCKVTQTSEIFRN